MGKYNFNYDRIKALESENAKLQLNNDSLKKAMEVLTKEVIALKQQVTGVPATRERTIFACIEDMNVLDELFGVRPAKGDTAIIRDNECTKNNFTTFARNISRAAMPAAVYVKRTGATTIGHKNLKDMSDEEYRIVTKLIADCVDLCYKAKKEIEGGTE